MQVGTGKSILNGIAIGKLKIYKKKDTVISTAQVADTAAEEARFEEARAKAIDQQTALYEKALAEAGEDIAEVFNIHAMMLDDDDFVDAIKEIINGQHMCAEYAVKKAGDNQAAVFAAMDDPYLQARSADVIDIAQAMLDILQGVDNATLQGTEPSILVAEDLAPSETVRMDKSLLLGFITREGSSNSHTAILARSMNIPALIQCKDIQDDWDGKMAVVDGYNACVYVDPTPDLLKSLKKRQQEDQKKQALLQELKGKPNTTLDGKTINVFANIGGMGDVGAVQQNDAGGVGLFRTEFVYLNCKDFPTEDYQFEAYKQVLESLAPRKVVVRTCDIGADKTVDYMKLDPVYRQYHHDKLAFGMLYNYTENFVLPLSHDEVVHGKKSILDRMPGDAWQKFANLRAYYGWMWAFPGKKLLFMGNEFAQGREWNHDASLDWHLLEGGDNWHHGVQRLVRDLNLTYRHHKAMHELDFDPYGFEWLVVDDKERSVLIFVRRDKEGNEIIVASNFTPVPRHDYRFGINQPGKWREILNTDSMHYHGSNAGNGGAVHSDEIASHGRQHSLSLTLPPLATIWLVREAE